MALTSVAVGQRVTIVATGIQGTVTGTSGMGNDIATTIISVYVHGDDNNDYTVGLADIV